MRSLGGGWFFFFFFSEDFYSMVRCLEDCFCHGLGFVRRISFIFLIMPCREDSVASTNSPLLTSIFLTPPTINILPVTV